MGTDHGTGPANPVSPAKPANKTTEPANLPAPTGAGFSREALIEVTRWNPFSPELEPLEDDEAEALEIEAEFKRRISGLRRLPRHARAEALRFSREQRTIALKTLREKRQRARHTRHQAW